MAINKKPAARHLCMRFKQTGSMDTFIGNFSISVNGKVTGSSIASSRIEVTCIKCGASQWIDAAGVQKKGRHLVRKP